MCQLIPVLFLLCQQPSEAEPPSRSTPSPEAACCGGESTSPVRRGIALRYLLNEPEVAGDLQLTEKQKQTVGELTQAYAGEAQQIHSDVFGTETKSNEERRELAREAGRKQRELRLGYETRFLSLLSEDQQNRIKQLDVQLAGIDALLAREVATQLELTREQLTSLLSLQREIHAEALKLHRKRQEDDAPKEEVQRALAELRRQKAERATDMLSAGQLERLAELQGPPITFRLADLKLKLEVPVRQVRSQKPDPQEPEPTLAPPQTKAPTPGVEG